MLLLSSILILLCGCSVVVSQRGDSKRDPSLGYADLSYARPDPHLTTHQCAFQLSKSRQNRNWLSFKRNYRKSYSSDCKEAIAFVVFLENMQDLRDKEIKAENSGKLSVEYGVNQYTDMSELSWARIFMRGVKHKQTRSYHRRQRRHSRHLANHHRQKSYGNLYSPNQPFNNRFSDSFPVNRSLPNRLTRRQTTSKTKNWENEGAVTPIKDQGTCGSCWAFAAIGAIESLRKINGNTLKQLSEQELLDCATDEDGCQGGDIEMAYDYMLDNGISLATSYKYTGVSDTCKKNGQTEIMLIDWTMLPSKNTDAIEKAVDKQPVVTFMHMKPDFKAYKNGVYDPEVCPDKIKYMNHGLIIIGYGESKEDGKYWIVRHSFGATWGEKGNMRIRRGVNRCGIELITAIPKELRR